VCSAPAAYNSPEDSHKTATATETARETEPALSMPQGIILICAFDNYY
jgi:hypothetical protein